MGMEQRPITGTGIRQWYSDETPNIRSDSPDERDPVSSLLGKDGLALDVGDWKELDDAGRHPLSLKITFGLVILVDCDGFPSLSEIVERKTEHRGESGDSGVCGE